MVGTRSTGPCKTPPYSGRIADFLSARLPKSLYSPGP
jgi:hypothetical protein